MKNYITVLNDGRETRINVNAIAYYRVSNTYAEFTNIHLLDGSEVRVLGSPEDIDDKIERSRKYL